MELVGVFGMYRAPEGVEPVDCPRPTRAVAEGTLLHLPDSVRALGWVSVVFVMQRLD
jgi:hypothetical protein